MSAREHESSISDKESVVQDTEKSKFVMDFGMGQQAPERITIEVLKQLIRENPKQMAYAARQPFRQIATLLLLVGEDAARILLCQLDENEKQTILKHISVLEPMSLSQQTAILREFTEVALQANSSLFGDADFAKAVQKTAPVDVPADNASAIQHI